VIPRVQWNAVLAGFCVTALGTLVATPLLEHIGWQVTAGPVDMLTMIFLLLGGFVAGRMGRRFEGIQGAVVAVLYIFAIWLTKQVLNEIHVANASGLNALGKVDTWSNFGKDFFYFIAGVLGGLWATPFNERERARETALLRTRIPSRRRPTPRPIEGAPFDDQPLA
jgi:hypothetical protein